MSTQGLYNSHPERERSPVKKLPAQLSTTTVFPGEHQRKVNQKMGLFTYLTLCLLGIFFLGAAEADTCAREWLQNQGNCYAYFDNKLSWQEAEIECQSYGRGAHLASVLTKAETLLVAEHISTYQQEPSHVWIGLQDVRQTGRWRWADESTYNYKSWMTHQPDNYLNSEHCVELVFSSGFTLWNDARCQRRNAYICKHEL